MLTKISGELSKYALHLVAVQKVRWDRGGTKPNQQATINLSVERSMKIMN
jgi:hypothetical protein